MGFSMTLSVKSNRVGGPRPTSAKLAAGPLWPDVRGIGLAVAQPGPHRRRHAAATLPRL